MVILLDKILDKMSTRIATLRKKSKGRDGVVASVKEVVKKRWESRVGYVPLQLVHSTR